MSKKGINVDEYIDKVINNWLIEDKLYKTDKGWLMTCKCLLCGMEVIGVNLYNIINGKSRNCGCARKKQLSESKRIHTVESLSQQKFGRLTVVEEAGRDSYGKIQYKCICDCGNETIVLGNSLLQNHVVSCGCLRSKNNSNISQILSKLGYDAVQEKYIKLYNNEISGIRFDNYIEELNLAIEYDGEGHFIPIDWAGKGEEWAIESLQSTQRRDEIKNNYCFENGIELLRISYLEIDDIENIIINKINEITNND
jgi:hypothetical protein